MDSTHPHSQPSLRYVWIPKGTRYNVKTNSGWGSRVNICGAIDIRTRNVIAKIYDTVNRFSIMDMLERIRKQYPDGERICLILDGAAYHKAKDVMASARRLNIFIKFLPPYSPNLNPIERLWKFMKETVLGNRHYAKLELLREELKKFFKTVSTKHKADLKTLITDNFSILGDP